MPRATSRVEDFEKSDPSRPALSPGDSILLLMGKIPSYLGAVLKELTLHYAPMPVPLSSTLLSPIPSPYV